MAKKHSDCEVGFTVTIYKEYTYTLPFTYTDVDLTGKDVVFKLIFDDVTYTYTETANADGSVITITDAVNGEFTLTITETETAGFEAAIGKWVLVLDGEILHIDVAEIVVL